MCTLPQAKMYHERFCHRRREKQQQRGSQLSPIVRAIVADKGRIGAHRQYGDGRHVDTE